MSDLVIEKREGVNWKQVGLFLGLTFGLTWLLDLALWLTVGYGQSVGTAVLLQLQMLLPAFCAVMLGLFVFKDSVLYQMRRDRERALCIGVQPAATVSPLLQAGACCMVPDFSSVRLLTREDDGKTTLNLRIGVGHVLPLSSGQ